MLLLTVREAFLPKIKVRCVYLC